VAFAENSLAAKAAMFFLAFSVRGGTSKQFRIVIGIPTFRDSCALCNRKYVQLWFAAEITVLPDSNRDRTAACGDASAYYGRLVRYS
jgi:hypothetical protein